VRIPDKWTDKLNKRAILKVVFSYHGEGGASISDVMTQFFPRVNIEHLMDLLTGATRDESDVLIHSMLNSSIDARVVDYIARDSYHLGIRGDSPVENEEIFQFVGVHRNRIALNVRGLAAAEQIIAQRYWLFSRFYWNRPNRRYASVLRTAFLGLSTTSNFLDTFVDDCLNLGFDDTLYYIEQKLSESHQEKLVDLSRFLMNRRSAEYIIRFDHNLTDIHELSGTFTKIDEMGAEERYALDQRISRELFGSDESCHGVMLDLPRENGKMKFGEDVIVMFKKGENSENTIASTSPIVGGIRESYDKQLRRLRLFVHPKVNALYEKTDVEDMFREFLITRL
jgi:HD superfamily phosphohydrolase